MSFLIEKKPRSRAASCYLISLISYLLSRISMKRLASLDVFRGFDMFFIMGGETLICAIAAACGYPAFEHKFGHVAWDGLQFMDLVFPTFLFIAGVSFPFSLEKQTEKGMSRLSISLRALKRGLLLVALGVFYNWAGGGGGRIPSVLGRIGLAWMFAAWIFIWIKGLRRRALVGLGLLVAYGVVSVLCVAPDAPAGALPMTKAGDFGCWIDRTLLAGRIYTPEYDPEGLFGVIPAIGTALLGMFTGLFVRRTDLDGSRKTRHMLLAAGVLLVVGLAVNFVEPINKALWSPAFVCAAGAYSLAVFALVYWWVDVKGRSCAATSFFRVIGLNSITIYLAQALFPFQDAGSFLVKSLAWHFGPAGQAVLGAVGYIIVCWTFLYLLHRKQIYLKV